MPEKYRLDWLHQEAKDVKYGSMTVELRIAAGEIVRAEVVAVKKSRTLAESQENSKGKESLVA